MRIQSQIQFAADLILSVKNMTYNISSLLECWFHLIFIPVFKHEWTLQRFIRSTTYIHEYANSSFTLLFFPLWPSFES